MKKAMFFTEASIGASRSGETVTVLDKQGIQYLVQFKDGTKIWAYLPELKFIDE